VNAPRITKKIAVRIVMQYPRLKSNSASFNEAVCFESLALENIQSDGHIQSSTGPGIQPIKGIKKPKFDNLHGEGVLLNQEFATSPAGPFIRMDITAKNVNKVSKNTSTLEILSRALYWPINNINEHTISINIAKSNAGNEEKNTIFFRRIPETKLTAEIVNVPVIKPTNKYIGK
tara:strand:- start:409 stop:933 length:525 start_codon:yes stop_codon:yes gene_type:complete